MATIFNFITALQQVYMYMIFAYIILSWLPNMRASWIGDLLGKLVEPYLSPFRKIIPPIAGVIDISPIVALFALNLVGIGLKVVVRFIYGLGLGG